MSALPQLLIKQASKSCTGKTITDPFQRLRKLPKYLPNEHTITHLDLPNFNLENNVFANSLKAPGRRDRITRQKTPKSYLIQLKAKTTADNVALVPQWPQSALMQSSYISNSRAACENLKQGQIKQSLPQSILVSPTFSVSNKFLDESLNEIKGYEKILRNYIFERLLRKSTSSWTVVDDNTSVDLIYDSTKSPIEIPPSAPLAFNFYYIPSLSEAELKVFPIKLNISKDKELIEVIKAFLDHHIDI